MANWIDSQADFVRTCERITQTSRSRLSKCLRFMVQALYTCGAKHIQLINSIRAVGYLTPVEVQVPASQKQEEQVAATEGNQNTQISPSGVEANRQRLVELVANAVRAVRTIRSRVVGDVTCAAARKEGLHVVAARLAWGRGEQVQLAGRTSDWAVVEFCGHEAGNQAGKAGARWVSIGYVEE
jgi:hypothetical protein